MTETPESLEAVRAPHLYATGFHVAGAGSEIVVLLLQTELQLSQGGVSENTAQSPVAMVHLGIQSAKELHHILGHAVSEYEKRFGEVISPNLQSFGNSDGNR